MEIPHPERSEAELGMIDRILYKVSGQSMQPAFHPGDLLLARHFSSVKMPINRGSIVIIRDNSDHQRLSLKRIIGLPGEDLHLLEGLLFVNDCHLTEPYLGGKPAYLGTDEHLWKVGLQEYFTMGDNRLYSTDSRHTGPVQDNEIIGVVKIRMWPLNRLGALRDVGYNL